MAEAGIDSAAVDSKILLSSVLNLSLGELDRDIALAVPLAAQPAKAFEAAVARRCNREPLQHIVGRAPFRHIELVVGPGVFIPRPETEVLVGTVLNWMDSQQRQQSEAEPFVVVDLCSGSGAIALAIASERPGSRVHAVERSERAVEYLVMNRDEVAPTVTIETGDALRAASDMAGHVDVVVSNPPYIPSHQPLEDPESEQDPHDALFGGDDGLDVIRGIAIRSRHLLRPGGLIALEHGEDQSGEVGEILKSHQFQQVQSLADLTGRLRFTIAILADSETAAVSAP